MQPVLVCACNPLQTSAEKVAAMAAEMEDLRQAVARLASEKAGMEAAVQASKVSFTANLM